MSLYIVNTKLFCNVHRLFVPLNSPLFLHSTVKPRMDCELWRHIYRTRGRVYKSPQGNTTPRESRCEGETVPPFVGFNTHT